VGAECSGKWFSRILKLFHYSADDHKKKTCAYPPGKNCWITDVLFGKWGNIFSAGDLEMKGLSDKINRKNVGHFGRGGCKIQREVIFNNFKLFQRLRSWPKMETSAHPPGRNGWITDVLFGKWGYTFSDCETEMMGLSDKIKMRDVGHPGRGGCKIPGEVILNNFKFLQLLRSWSKMKTSTHPPGRNGWITDVLFGKWG
jgi:hypothetical protein